MGPKHSRHEPLNDKLYCSIDMDMQPVDQFKVLGCGHIFCVECLEAWKEQKLINCPKCRYEEKRSLYDLTDPRYYEGPLYIDQSPEDEDIKEIQTLLHAQMVRRAKTINILLDAADAVTQIELSAAGVKIGGAVAGLVGTGMVVTGGVLSLTGVGAVAGVPLAMAGAAVGGTGGLVVGGGIIGEMISKKQELKGANEYLQSDYFHSMQLRILIGRAARSESFAEKLNIALQDALGFIGLVGRTAKFGLAATNLARAIATGLARGAGTAGLHVAGIAIGAVLIPIDLFQMISNSIKIHKKEKAEIAKDLENIADELRTELFSLLKERQYQLVELERYDDDKQKHCLLLAVEESELEMVSKSNLSLPEVRKEHVVILDVIGPCLDGELYQEMVDKWITSNILDEDSSENDEDDDNIEDGYQIVGEDDILLERRC